MRQVVERYQRVRRGGLTCRNWLHLEYASENWDAAVEADGSTSGSAAVERHPVEHHDVAPKGTQPEKERDARCGSRDVKSTSAAETERRLRMTSEL